MRRRWRPRPRRMRPAASGGHRAARARAHRRRHGRVANPVSRGAWCASRGSTGARSRCFISTRYIGLPDRSPGELPEVSARATDPAGRHHPLPSARRRARRRGRVPRGRTAAAAGARGRGDGRHRRERPPGVQRSAGRFRDRDPVSHRAARRAMPASAGRGGLVRHPGGRAGDRDLDVGAPDPPRPPSSASCRTSGRRRPCADSIEGPIDPMIPASILRRHPDLTVYLDRASASLLEGCQG